VDELISTIQNLLSELADDFPAEYKEIARGIVYYEKSLAQVLGNMGSSSMCVGTTYYVYCSIG